MESLPAFHNEQTLLPVIAQDEVTGAVLMLAWMNREAFETTCRTKLATYYSRSRKRLWRKGETSGHVQHVKSIAVDCDGDSILLQVEQLGPACHEGYRSCFFRHWDQTQWRIQDERLVDPKSVYDKPAD